MTAALVRDERDGDRPAVGRLISTAFEGRPHASGTEARIHAALHAAGAATVALVAEEDGLLVGQVVLSPVTLDGRASGWHALGPVAVAPDRQGRGIGTALVTAGLARLRGLGSEGCLLLGDGRYYGRFGFRPPARLTLPGLPAGVLFVLPFGEEPAAAAAFHPAFGA